MTDEIVETASRRALRQFKHIHGNILDQDDFRQVGSIYLWLMRDRTLSRGMLYTIILRRMIDYGRRCTAGCRSTVKTEFVSIDLLLDEMVDESPSSLDRLLVEEEHKIMAQLQWLLICSQVGLTPKQLTALQLYFLEDLTLEQTAKRCNCSPRAIGFHVRDGVEKVRRYLAEAA